MSTTASTPPRSRSGCSSAPGVPATQWTGQMPGGSAPRQSAGSTGTSTKEPWSGGCQSRVATTRSKSGIRRLSGATTSSPPVTARAPPSQKSRWRSTIRSASTPASAVRSRPILTDRPPRSSPARHRARNVEDHPPMRDGPGHVAPWLGERAAGVLLHVTSLPGGRLGPEALGFVDWLAEAGQSWWQILPLGPPDASGSPYELGSAFAGWTGLLAEPDAPVTPDDVADFAARHAYWTWDWDPEREGDLAGQVRFEREWGALRAHAQSRGVRLLGDMPLYVGPSSADVAARPWLFAEGEVAGAPPDFFSDDGQLWGSPLYDWAAMRREGFRWGSGRERRPLELVDAVRIDHFRGLVAGWAVDAAATTARDGQWRRAPGRAMLDAVHAELGEAPLLAEDLGLITPAVERLRTETGLPGMVV